MNNAGAPVVLKEVVDLAWILFPLSVTLFGVAIGQAFVAGKSIEAMARQPDVSGPIRLMFLFALGFLEALALYILITTWMIMAKIR